MDNFNAVIAALGTIITVICSSGLGYLIKQMVEASKLRKQDRKCSEDGHAETQRLLKEFKMNQDDVIAQLEAQNAAKDKRIAKLERDLSNALAIREKR